MEFMIRKGADPGEPPVRPNLKYRAWIIPQVPGKPFTVQTGRREEAEQVEIILALFQLFLYDQGVMPDYSNATSVEEWDGEDWMDCDDD